MTLQQAEEELKLAYIDYLDNSNNNEFIRVYNEKLRQYKNIKNG